MLRQLFSSACILLAVFSPHAKAQKAPSTELLLLSLKTVGKALAGCRESYTIVEAGARAPLLQSVIGADSYTKTLKSLDSAETFTKFLIEHPDQIKVGPLVLILSTSDDFSIGIGSTRTEILASLIRSDSKTTEKTAIKLNTVSANLNACQKSLFNAGDDYLELVMQLINAQDRLVGEAKKSR